MDHSATCPVCGEECEVKPTSSERDAWWACPNRHRGFVPIEEVGAVFFDDDDESDGTPEMSEGAAKWVRFLAELAEQRGDGNGHGGSEGQADPLARWLGGGESAE